MAYISMEMHSSVSSSDPKEEARKKVEEYIKAQKAKLEEINNNIATQEGIINTICSPEALSATIPEPIGYMESLGEGVTAFDDPNVTLRADGTISTSLVNASTNTERIQIENDVVDKNPNTTEIIYNELLEKQRQMKAAIAALAQAKKDKEKQEKIVSSLSSLSSGINSKINYISTISGNSDSISGISSMNELKEQLMNEYCGMDLSDCDNETKEAIKTCVGDTTLTNEIDSLKDSLNNHIQSIV